MTKLPPEMIGTQNGDVVRYWQQRTAEAEAELARLTPVVEAARAYQATGRIDSFTELDRLFAAVDAPPKEDR